MLLKIFGFITGIFIISYSISLIILYLNLLNMGYDFWKYLLYICKNAEIYLIPLGIMLLVMSLKRKKGTKVYKSKK